MIPAPWQGIVLALAVWRLWRLVAVDDLPLLDPLHRRLGQDYPTVHKWLTCPFCSGAWFSALALACWWANATWTMYGAAIPALSAAVGLIATRLDGD